MDWSFGIFYHNPKEIDFAGAHHLLQIFFFLFFIFKVGKKVVRSKHNIKT
jgi:hypothetical protein